MTYYYSPYLYHHGILGMKWGVRRFQNKDGSVTAKGAQRYYSEYGDNYHRSDDPQNAPNKTGKKRKGLTDKQKKALIVAGVAAVAVVGGVALYKSGALNKAISGSISKGKKYASLTSNKMPSSKSTISVIKKPIVNTSPKQLIGPSAVKQLLKPVQKPISTPQNIYKPRVRTSDLHKAVPKSSVNRIEVPRAEVKRVEVPRTEVPRTKIERVEIPKVTVNRTKVPELKFGEGETFSSSDMKRMQANFNKAFGSASSATKSAWTNEGQDFAEQLLKKNMSALGF